MLVPKLIATLKDYNRQQLTTDLSAGVIVGLAALPLALAFAVASGVPPERGLLTAVVAGALIAALGGSRVQIGGPAALLVVIASGIVALYGLDGLMLATLLAGAILIVLGLAGLAGAIKCIPSPVIIGLKSGIALLIVAGAATDFLGLGAGRLNAWAIAAAVTTLAISALWPRVDRRIPAPFVALIVSTVLVRLLHLPVDTVASRFGAIHAALPAPALPHVTLALAKTLMPPALALALLIAMESLRSAVVADGMMGGRHGSNMELVAAGVANIAAALVGGIPASGAMARTVTNVKRGGRTPVAGVAHAATVLLVVLIFARFLGFVPMAALAAILVIVAYHLSAWRSFAGAARAPRSDVAVMLGTFLLTVAVDVTVAVAAGMVLGVFLFMRRMSEVAIVSAVAREFQEEGDDYDTDPNATSRRAVPPRCLVYEINGPFCFDAAQQFRDTITAIDRAPRVLILRMRHVPAIDSTGLHALTGLVRRARRRGTLVILSDVHAQPMMALGRARLLDELGDEQAFGNIDDALNRARVQLNIPTIDRPPFATATVRRETQAIRPVLVEEDGERISGPRKTQARFTPPGRPSQS